MTSSSSSEKPYFRSLRTKLTAANAAIMLLLLALQVVIYLWVAQGQVSDSIRLNNSLVDSVGHNADVIYQDTVSQINVVTMNEQLQEQLRYPIGADTENHQANRKIRSLVNERFLSLDTADAIYIRDARSVQRLYWRRTNLPEMIVPTFDFDGVDIPETGWVAADMHAGNLVFVRRILARSRAIFMFFIATLMIPLEVIMIPIFRVINVLGLYNTFAGVIIPPAATPTGVFIARQFFLTVPNELMESARIDGASESRIFTRIMLPLSKPIISVLAIFSFMWRWNDFMWPLLVLRDNQKFTLQLALQNFNGQYSVDWSSLLSMSVISMIPVLIIFLIFQRQFVEGMVTTGLKD